MKKFYLFLMLFVTTNALAHNENEEDNRTVYNLQLFDTNESKILLSVEDALLLETSQSKQESKLYLSDYSFFGLNYAADFNYAGEGVLGLEGHILGCWSNTIGFSLGFGYGLPFDNGYVQFRLGPNFGFPITKNVCLFVPVEGVLNSVLTGSGKDESWKTSFGVQASPSVGLKFGRFGLSAGIAIGWAEKADKVSTGFSVGIGYDF